mmetsp:Transcript_5206/g.9554  ORF Transcript_5206/g.9554 Transcript_5206/m.9554 type:complete len:171 (+) Transcript_5206:258-770(+)|eukprot:CAMPEP_0183732342 /NCGR_PEP_ID=MMETSP0737-20130205/38235_1 /TAXON_ID=385413 /ORGANISM="Thalassiosira miniscula, Strain CCMP1093" /LENGTH=170 /DNA_ID=CAMNT_0025965335 /DNA_START=319 /DNA_END=831 /DNA_ORIENTATION=-
MNGRGDSSEEPKRANKAEEIALMIRNNSKIQAIVSAHRDDVLTMFKTDATASKMIALRMENCSAMKYCLSKSPSTLPSSLPSVLQELLVKAEEEAMQIYQIVNAYHDAVLAMFKSGVTASKLVSLRLENQAAMKTCMAFAPTMPSVLQGFLVECEEDAMREFQGDHLHGH